MVVFFSLKSVQNFRFNSVQNYGTNELMRNTIGNIEKHTVEKYFRKHKIDVLA